MALLLLSCLALVAQSLALLEAGRNGAHEKKWGHACVCVGYKNHRGVGGPECSGRGNPDGKTPWCYVPQVARNCPDLRGSLSYADYQWSEYACKNTPKPGQCKCIGHKDKYGRGGSDCRSKSGGDSWCYVGAGNYCMDAQEGDIKILAIEWSKAACTGVLEKQCPPVCSQCKAGEKQLVNGKCTHYCSQYGYCGTKSDYVNKGTNCAKCAGLAADSLAVTVSEQTTSTLDIHDMVTILAAVGLVLTLFGSFRFYYQKIFG